MIEVHWGQPVVLLTPHAGDAERFGTIEKARYWLRRKWPVSDSARRSAIAKVEAAMECLSPVEDARQAFLAAALSAGFVPAAAGQA
ncbi:DUF982 domain-containing protein [Psychromarinibacter halotolerans]|uniref:DUF982 domain-containing protein n=1 Tax=Psychromarinibacter halotolerans TaxID=1775175 RepID=A0ABV7GXW4_9RHOB|nr:DUF982 domain-containing protein [Psychromarinibacter halotolerans]MDF0598383.1 DUF982 domain-containing protein [Psychromarinibacter halotolerans]